MGVGNSTDSMVVTKVTNTLFTLYTYRNPQTLAILISDWLEGCTVRPLMNALLGRVYFHVRYRSSLERLFEEGIIAIMTMAII
jgi:hypothetical protein